MPSKLEPYDLSGDKLELLQQCFSQPGPNPIPILEVYKKRPKPSELRNRAMEDLSLRDLKGNRHPTVVMAAFLRSIQRSWESYTQGSAGPSEFMRTPFGAPYEIVSIEKKERGIIASRDIKAGEIILQESPVLVLPPSDANTITFLTLPQKALEAIMLLHNAKPDFKRFSLDLDIPVHRLLDLLRGILDTNCFGPRTSFGNIGALLLTGSLFNYSDTPNLTRAWDDKSERMAFTSVRDIEEGDELEVDYMPGIFGGQD